MQGRRRLIIMSDIEMGAGGVVDDFPHDAWLAELITERVAAADSPVELVFNGDTLDFLKTGWQGRYPRHIDAGVALGKLSRISAAHPAFFEVLRSALRRGPCERVVFLPGNHDQELAFPQVRQRIRHLLGDDERVIFPDQAWRVGDVHIEHGHQTDVIFATDPEHPFVEIDGRPVLDLPWGSVALLEVTLPMVPTLYAFDRLRPRGLVLELLPDAKELLLSSFWHYWTREYLPRAWRGQDPLTRLSWTMLKEIAYRFGTTSTTVSSGKHWKEALKGSEEVRLVVLGHEHRTEWWTWADRKLLRDGCVRDEYHLHKDGRIGRRLPKVWAEATLQDGEVVQSCLVEREAPQGEPWPMPESVYDLLPAVRAQLAHTAPTAEDQAARLAHDRAEPVLGDGETDDTRDHPARSLDQAARAADQAGRGSED